MGRRGSRHGGGNGRPGGSNFRQGGGGGGGGGGPAAGGALPPPPPPQVVTEEHPPVKGPHPSYVCVASQYTLEQQLRQMLRDNGCDPAREDTYRVYGVQLIDNVRESLQLPVKTFATACTYYHRFRLNFRDAEYNFNDASLAALFVACKVEDTIKKSREVLCAAYNLKNADKPTTPDDKIFDKQSNIIVGLDRLILQTIGFDFRVRHPQKLLIKLIRQLIPAEDGREFVAVAYPMAIDLYKTFAPIKQTSFTMALSVVELTALLLNKHMTAVRGLALERYHTSRGCIVETLLDLLDLYTEFGKLTKVGQRFDLDRLIEIKIKINQEVEHDPGLRRIESWCDRCAALDDRDASHNAAIITPGGSATSPATTGSSWQGGVGGAPSVVKPNQKKPEGTMRFVFEADKMRQEQAEVAEYFKEEYEEETIEVDEPIPEPPSRGGGAPYPNNHHHGNRGGHGPARRDRNNNGSNNHNGHHNHHGGGHHPGGSGNGQGDSGWAPYPRSRGNDRRHPPRKGGHY